MTLRLASLTSGYGRVRIVNDVSLQVGKAEILAVIGRNGVGKTTLLRTIMGSLRAISGQIALGGTDITRSNPTARARMGIGYVPQGRGIFSKMTVEGNLKLGATVGSAGSAASLDRAFSYFPVLKKRLAQPAGSMSGGEQQQLAIGRILVGSPEIILLDEPSEGIQPNIVREIGEIIRRLRESAGMTVLIVEQNLELIRRVADRCAIMEKGRIVAMVSPEELDDPETARKYLAI